MEQSTELTEYKPKNGEIRIRDIAGSGKDKFITDFKARWLLTYKELGVPLENQVRDHDIVAGYAESIMQRFFGLRVDVLFACWDRGVREYYIEAQKITFPVFNIAALNLWIELHRQEEIGKVTPPPKPVALLPEHERTPAEQYEVFKNFMPAVKEIAFSTPGIWQPMFQAIADSLTEDEKFEVKRIAWRGWINKVCMMLLCEPKTFAGMPYKIIHETLKKRWVKAGKKPEEMPNINEFKNAQLFEYAERVFETVGKLTDKP